LLEIIVTIAIISMISAAVTVAVVKYQEGAKIKLTRTNAQTIRSGVKSWWIDHDSSSCPTVQMLVADGALERGKSIKFDAWEQPWSIECKDSDVDVVSRGPDKTADTEDDIRVPTG